MVKMFKQIPNTFGDTVTKIKFSNGLYISAVTQDSRINVLTNVVDESSRQEYDGEVDYDDLEFNLEDYHELLQLIDDLSRKIESGEARTEY
jgi:hypothetical protein